MCGHGVAPLKAPFKRTCCQAPSWLTASSSYSFTCIRALKLSRTAPDHWLTTAAAPEPALYCRYQDSLMGNLCPKPLHRQDPQTCTVVEVLPIESFLLAFLSSFMGVSVRHQGHISLKALHAFLCALSSLSITCINPRKSLTSLVPVWCMFLSRTKLTEEVRPMEENELLFL